ncbi:hypothetical protein [Devosia neptuniae]|jgi:hypothetical protein|uniref:hypothetical protein n=1 Tax=Devosia neptuniae TaxID=191302 RepID=UPI0022B0178B|nr:hypothetical protein [Devosia neptuniae]MCZ4347883.1 hypothetical protein [Devosia neptuniae]|tara:strand:- start:14509 stop:14838 length:330 start_codon:yes stop_codon:yes gene_type:complete
MPSSEEFFADMIASARQAAGDFWADVRASTISACRSMAEQLALIAKGFALGEFTEQDVKADIEAVRKQLIASLAATIMKIEGLAARIINSALTAVRDAINNALGFELIA